MFILGWRGAGLDIHLGTKTSQASLRLESAALALLISRVVVEEGGGGWRRGEGQLKRLSSAIAIWQVCGTKKEKRGRGDARLGRHEVLILKREFTFNWNKLGGNAAVMEVR